MHAHKADSCQVHRHNAILHAWRTWFCMDHLMQDALHVAPKWSLTCQQLVEDYSQAVNVAPRIDAFALRLFGAHVGRGPQNRPGDGDQRLPLAPGQAEIHQKRLAAFVEHNVRRLDVTVNHTALMRVLQSIGQDTHNSCSLPRLELAGSQGLAQRLTANKFRHDEGLLARPSDFVHRDDVPMMQGRRALRLANESLLLPLGSEDAFSGHFDRDDSPKTGVNRAKNSAEAPLPDGIDQSEAAQRAGRDASLARCVATGDGRTGKALIRNARRCRTRGADDRQIGATGGCFQRCPARALAHVARFRTAHQLSRGVAYRRHGADPPGASMRNSWRMTCSNTWSSGKSRR